MEVYSAIALSTVPTTASLPGNALPSPRPALALLFDSAESLLLPILASFEIFSVERGFLRQSGGASQSLWRKLAASIM
jgi:hypothetical protein